MRVHRSLNHFLAMMLCWTANRPRRPASIAMPAASGPVAGPSSVVGTKKPPMNPTAYRNVAKKIA